MDTIQEDLGPKGPTRPHYKVALLMGHGSQGCFLNNTVPNVESYSPQWDKTRGTQYFSFKCLGVEKGIDSIVFPSLFPAYNAWIPPT